MEKLHQLIINGRWIAIFMGAIALHVILIYSVMGIWITRPASQGYDNLFSVLITSEGQRIILYDSIWKKGTRYSIKDPGGFTNCFVVRTNITGKYGNSSVNIPVILQFNVAKEYPLGMKLEIFEALFKDQNKENLSIKQYVVNVFEKLNESQKGAIDQVVAEYAQMKISDPEFLNRIVDLVVFPERLFSCIADVKICLENPTFSSCKGMACGDD